MWGWSAHIFCTSAVHLSSWRTQLMAYPGRLRSHVMPEPCLTLGAQMHFFGSPRSPDTPRYAPLLTLRAWRVDVVCSMTGRVVHAQSLFPEAATAQEVKDLPRFATTRGGEDPDEDWHGTSAPPKHIRTSCGVWGENMEKRDRFAFLGWAVYPRCALNTA